MKKESLVVSGIVFLLLLTLVSASNLNIYGKIILSAEVSAHPNIVLWLPFDEGSGCTANDLSQYNNDGILKPDCPTNSPTWGSLTFDGVDDYVEVPDSSSLDLTNKVTIEAWINPQSYPFYPGIVCKGNVGNYGESYCLFLEDGTGRLGFLLNSDGTSGGRTIIYSPPISQSTLTYAAVTYDGATMRMYINGAEVSNDVHIGGIFTTDYPVVIAKAERENSPYPTTFFNGILDEPRIWNIALTTDQIQSIYQAGVS